MSAFHPVLGIDVGSTSLAVVAMDGGGSVLAHYYAPHGGDLRGALAAAGAALASAVDNRAEASVVAGPSSADVAPPTTVDNPATADTAPPSADAAAAGLSPAGVAVTGGLAGSIRGDLTVDSRVACIRSVRERHPGAGAILLVGGEHFSLIRFDREGNYRSVRTNTSCAAGTGGFLDQQAGRLAMADGAQLSATALENRDPVPLVATRCAVFAKTDLIHAQQEGYSLPAISTGLCRGVARNLVDTLFKGEEVLGPVVVTGGVARNSAVMQEIAALLPEELQLVVDEQGHLQGATGAAWMLLDRNGEGVSRFSRPKKTITPVARLDVLYRHGEPDRVDMFPPLELNLSSYPDFTSLHSWVEGGVEGGTEGGIERGVEVDIYRTWWGAQDAYLGIDIGSTSTKAALTTLEGEMLGGFYTRTAGRPLEAVQALLRAITLAAERLGTEQPVIHGSATTGSGRAFIGGIVRADQILDEISAHARAAVELDPNVDTILEIGGQDSKFTTLRKGRVTSSVMNTVCAAGTGSFIEEQARRLGVAITDYADRTAGVRAPRVNDRCTVFMDRDINHLLATGYSVEEVLAAALHAVRENYLNRVAVEKRIGQVVFFQGATAKNRSLVAAFEQKLEKPILVSPWCHLTGALGAALTLVDERVVSDRFVGLDLHRRDIPVRREICRLCTNHCKLTVAEMDGRQVAFGFLCGRDYETERFVNRNSSGFELLRERRALDRRLEAEILGESDGSETLPSATAASATAPTTTVPSANVASATALAATVPAETVPSATAASATGPATNTPAATPPVIGLPPALYLANDLAYWQVFFRTLGIPTRSGATVKDPIRRGRLLTGAEFCAPMTALHGHAQALLEEADYLFLPVYLERKPEKAGASRKYCYYSQFASALVVQSLGDQDPRAPADDNCHCEEGRRPEDPRAHADDSCHTDDSCHVTDGCHVNDGFHPGGERPVNRKDRILTPLVSSRYSRFHLVGELHRALAVLGEHRPRFHRVAFALEAANRFREQRSQRLCALYERARRKTSFDVMLLGRPYTVLSETMNKGIPGIFGSLGIRTFYQDMLPRSGGDAAGVEPLLQEINWNYGAAILEAAEVVAGTPGLYPVMITSFKCGPDSFVIEYARRIFDAHDKPYLLLELDEHDSSVGYETRIEAALRSFGTHYAEEARATLDDDDRCARGPAKARGAVAYEGINPRYLRTLDRERTLVVPRWDDYTIPLIAAIFNGQGYRTIVMEETDATIRRSLRWNNGQCIPMNAVAEGFVATVRGHGLDPSATTLWIPSADFSCNIRLFPHHIQETLKLYGAGFENAKVYLGHLTHIDMSPVVIADAYLAHMFSGLIRRIACRIRPYEHNPGETDRVVDESLAILQEVFIGARTNKSAAVVEIMERFERIPFDREEQQAGRRPKVALFGDIYVRDNPVMNQGVIHYIEQHGGEVVTMPFHEFARMTVEVYFRRWMWEGKLGRLLALKPLMAAMSTMERWYYRHFEPVIGEPVTTFGDKPADILARFNVRLDHEGESQDNLLKTWYISRRHPDLALFVQLNPGFCCAGLVTEAMSERIRRVTGVPVLSITYDGTGGNRNDAILPYLMYPADRQRESESAGTAAGSA